MICGPTLLLLGFCVVGTYAPAQSNQSAESATETAAHTPASVADTIPDSVELTEAPVSSAEADTPVFVIPIQGMIERGLVYVIRRGVAQAEESNAAAIIIDMNTPGGRVDSAENIINMLGRTKVPTYTLVNPNAISAGALISMSTRHIYMTPGSRIGDAMPIMMSPGGGAQEMSEAHEEKAVSYVASLIRSVAQENGHDPQLAECMVRRKIEYKIGEEIICKEGEILTLTNLEAVRMVGEGDEQRRLLAAGTVENMGELLKEIGLAGARIVTVEATSAESIARYIEQFSFLFLAGGLLGLYVEFKTPGFGLPGGLGLLLLAFWFWGHNIAGLAGAGEAVLFLAGVILLGVELFLLPGFGIAGLAGISCVLVALLMAMVPHVPTDSWWDPGLPSAIDFKAPLIHLAGAMIITGVLGILLARYLPKTSAFRYLALETATDAANGYTSSDDTTDLVGREGISLTALRPSGTGRFDNQRLSVVSRGDFIDADMPIRIAESHGSRIIVEAIQDVS